MLCCAALCALRSGLWALGSVPSRASHNAHRGTLTRSPPTQHTFVSGLPGDALQVAAGGVHLNPVAAALVFVLTGALLFGVRESFHVNALTVAITVASILITIIAGATQINAANYVPFVPPEKGIGGVVSAASAVFFACVFFFAGPFVCKCWSCVCVVCVHVCARGGRSVCAARRAC